MELGDRLNQIVPEGYTGTGAELADILERIGFEAETCDVVAAMPFLEAFDTTHRYLSDYDFEADEILAPFMNEPEEI